MTSSQTCWDDAYILVITTCDKEETAQSIARALINEKLAACAQISPMRSVYRWNDGLEEAHEWRLDLKLRKRDYADLEQALLRMHPYEVPEIICLPIIAGHRPYFEWIENSARAKS